MLPLSLIRELQHSWYRSSEMSSRSLKKLAGTTKSYLTVGCGSFTCTSLWTGAASVSSWARYTWPQEGNLLTLHDDYQSARRESLALSWRIEVCWTTLPCLYRCFSSDIFLWVKKNCINKQNLKKGMNNRKIWILISVLRVQISKMQTKMNQSTMRSWT